ncbi:MAG: DUF4350 domain-containing protein [Dysgonamonadaceae bacterium]|jgi:hypothetical protein|nr:DUF4350 domain-containing protein [Dysgonamonadaceae bacterium]
MRNKIFYIVCLLALFLLLYWNNKNIPVKFVWSPTYNTEDKQPLGAFVLDELLKASWEKGYTHTYESIQELADSGVLDDKNLLIITETFQPTDEELDELLIFVKRGGNALIVSQYFYGLSDKLAFYVGYDYVSDLYTNLSLEEKFNTFRFCAPDKNEETYRIPVSISSGYFNCNYGRFPNYYGNMVYNDSVYAVAECDTGKIVTLRYQMRKGNLLLSANPRIFTNYGILNDSINPYIWNTLAYLQDKPLIRTEYYHAGSQYGESQSPFRYLLSVRPLKWAFYITLMVIGIFMIFTAKRKQRPIPVVKPPDNKMLGFVRSIAALYIRKNNNADVVLKKYTYWADDIKRNYGIDIINERHDEDFFERFAAKTGQSTDDVKNLFRYLDRIDEKTNVSDSQMIELINKMNNP